MIPINLKVQGFLTFKNPIEIDFEVLNEDGIFLISGPTGAGKTSLFDAISFALYGVATTSGRNAAKDLRSHLIGADGDLNVEFTFQAGGHEYTVRRWQKGSGDLKQRLVKDGGEQEALTKVTEIKNEITDALGLSADQFCKIVMLPQGEFRNFLVASSKEKSDILRKLFDTDHYARIRYLISEKLKGIYARFSQAETIINSEKLVSEQATRSLQPEEITAILAGEQAAACADCEAVREKLKSLRLSLDNLSLRLDAAGKLNKDLDEQAALEGLLGEALALEADFARDLAKADLLNKIRPVTEQDKARLATAANLLRKQSAKEALETALTASRADLEKAALARAQNPARQSRLMAIARETDQTAVLLEALAKLQTAQAEEAKTAARVEALRARIAERDRLTAHREALLITSESQTAQELALSSRWADLRAQYASLNQALRDMKSYQDKQASLAAKTQAREKTEQALTALKATEVQLGAQAKELKEQFEKQGLAQFAHLVEPGKACPLCGSLDHPAPFTDDPTLSSARLKAAEGALRDTERQRIETASRLEHLSEEIRQLEEQLRAARAELPAQDLEADLAGREAQLASVLAEGTAKAGELEALRADKDRLRLDREATEQALGSLQTVQAEYDRYNDELTRLRLTVSTLAVQTKGEDRPVLLSRQRALETEKAATEALIQQTEADFTALSQQVTELTTSHRKTGEDVSELTAVLAEQEDLFTQSLASLELSRAEFGDLARDLPNEPALRKGALEFFRNLDGTRARAELMRAKLQGRTKTDLSLLEAQIATGRDEVEATQTQYDGLIRREAQLANALTKIRAAAELHARYSRELEVARKLDGTTGKGTTFENYVLGYYLEGVLANANVRLKNMTNGRFTLVRQAIDQDGRRSIEGLDINVYDTYSNSQRDVKTLSGGESFKASLAMALGLSDFIQENRSGIRLDTIFIDEGFGTLDQESLDSAMETILEIQDLGRLVGIISHVEELKERIPTQLVVENRGAEGSSVRIVKH